MIVGFVIFQTFSVVSGYENPSIYFLACLITENAVKALSKAPCCYFEDAPNTALTIVLIFNVSIDYNWFEVTNPFTRKYILK